MSFAKQAENAVALIDAEVDRRKRDSKAKSELMSLQGAFTEAQRGHDQEETNRQWLEQLDETFYSGIPANKRFLKKVCFPFDRDIESPIKS
jgi:hypothetical protein